MFTEITVNGEVYHVEVYDNDPMTVCAIRRKNTVIASGVAFRSPSDPVSDIGKRVAIGRAVEAWMALQLSKSMEKSIKKSHLGNFERPLLSRIGVAGASAIKEKLLASLNQKALK